MVANGHVASVGVIHTELESMREMVEETTRKLRTICVQSGHSLDILELENMIARAVETWKCFDHDDRSCSSSSPAKREDCDGVRKSFEWVTKNCWSSSLVSRGVPSHIVRRRLLIVKIVSLSNCPSSSALAKRTFLPMSK